MTRSSLFLKYCFAVAIVGIGFIVSYAVLAQTTVSAEPSRDGIAAGISFPIPELGNCTDKNACRSYCNESANMSACIQFAEAHGLVNKDEAVRAKKFAERVGNGTGPGGCNSPEGCKSFCADIQNIDACIAFAEKEGLKGERYEDGKKISTYLKSGGTLPGGCTSKETCEVYCGEFSHAEECSAFAKKVGIGALPLMGTSRGGSTSEQMKKFSEFAVRGETPGACASRSECEVYCKESAHFEECVAFGEKVGFFSSGEAKKIQENRGRGPGTCDSSESCRVYCNDESHREECFKFAEEHKLISQEGVTQVKEGWVRARAGFDDAPPEVRECLKATLGQNVIEDMQSGKLVPGPEIGEKMRACFEKFGARQNTQDIFKNAPPEMKACLKEKLGDAYDKVVSAQALPSPEMADSFRICLQSVQFRRSDLQGASEAESIERQKGNTPRFGEFLRTAPPVVVACFKEKLGEDFQKLQSGVLPPSPDAQSKMRLCFESFRPEKPIFDRERGEFRNPSSTPSGEFRNFPPGMEACLRMKVGEEALNKMQPGVRPSPEIDAAMRACLPQAGPLPVIPRPVDQGEGGGTIVLPQPDAGIRSSLNWPEAVRACLKENLSEDVFLKIQQGGQPSLDVEAKIKECFSKVQGSFPGSVDGAFPFPTAGDSGTRICVQIIVHAKEPISGICKEFPTPCDVPLNWEKVESCVSPNVSPSDSNTSPSAILKFFSAVFNPFLR